MNLEETKYLKTKKKKQEKRGTITELEVQSVERMT